LNRLLGAKSSGGHRKEALGVAYDDEVGIRGRALPGLYPIPFLRVVLAALPSGLLLFPCVPSVPSSRAVNVSHATGDASKGFGCDWGNRPRGRLLPVLGTTLGFSVRAYKKRVAVNDPVPPPV